jgi:hypothetical protein
MLWLSCFSPQLANCHDDEQSLKLAQELQAVLHEHVEQLRQTMATLPMQTRHESKQK